MCVCVCVCVFGTFEYVYESMCANQNDYELYQKQSLSKTASLLMRFLQRFLKTCSSLHAFVMLKNKQTNATTSEQLPASSNAFR